MMAHIDSLFEGVRTFFLWKFPMLSHFLILKTITDDSRLRHCLGFETPFLYRAAVTGLISFIFLSKFFSLNKLKCRISITKIFAAQNMILPPKKITLLPTLQIAFF